MSDRNRAVILLDLLGCEIRALADVERVAVAETVSPEFKSLTRTNSLDYYYENSRQKASYSAGATAVY